MERIEIGEDICSLLEFEIGFKGKFVVEQQCKHLGIDPNDLTIKNVAKVSDNVHQVLIGLIGQHKADIASRGLGEYIQAVKNVMRAKANAISKACSYVILGDKGFYIGKYDKAMEYYHQAQNLLFKSRKTSMKLECRIKRKMARILCNSKEHYNDARKEYNKVIEIGTVIKDNYEVALGHLGLGNLEWQEGDGEKALKLFFKALEHIEQLPSENRSEKVRRKKAEGLVHMALGDLYLALNDVDKAVSHDENAIDILLDLDNYLGVARLYKKMGIIYKQKKEYENIMIARKREAFSSDESAQILMESWTRMNLASLLMVDGKYNIVEEHLSRAFDILSDYDYPEAHSRLHYLYGDLFQRKKDNEASKEHFHKSLDFIRGQNAPEFFAQAQEGLGTLYLCNGEEDKGKKLLRSALIWHENNNNVVDIKRINSLLTVVDDYQPIGIILMNQP